MTHVQFGANFFRSTQQTQFGSLRKNFTTIWTDLNEICSVWCKLIQKHSANWIWKPSAEFWTKLNISQWDMLSLVQKSSEQLSKHDLEAFWRIVHQNEHIATRYVQFGVKFFRGTQQTQLGSFRKKCTQDWSYLFEIRSVWCTALPTRSANSIWKPSEKYCTKLKLSRWNTFNLV